MDEREKVRLLAERLHRWTWWDTALDFDGEGVFFAFWEESGANASVYELSDDPTRSWNPFTSRDDAHECLEKLTDAQTDRLITEMRRSAPDNTNAVEWYLLTATPAQISEALCRMLEAQS